MPDAVTVQVQDDGSIHVTEAPDEAEFSPSFLRGLQDYPTLGAGYDGEYFTVRAANGVFCWRVHVRERDIKAVDRIEMPVYGFKIEQGGLQWRRATEGRCMRCGNWPQICGHGLPFKERKASIGIQRMWAGTK